jgi:hypothetical protein
MARLYTTGFGLQSFTADGFAVSNNPGAVSYSTSTVRNTGSTSLRVNPSATILTNTLVSLTNVVDTTVLSRVYARFPTLPVPASGIGLIEVGNGTNWCDTTILSDGTMRIETNIGVLGNSTTALTTNTWYRFESSALVSSTTTDTFSVSVYPGDDLTPLLTLGPFTQAWQNVGINYSAIGALASVAVTWDVYFSDWAINSSAGTAQTTAPGPGQVFTLRPAGAGTAGTAEANWTKPGGATTTKETAVDNTPPVFLADSTSAADAEKMLRNATAASSDTTHTVMDYTSAGIAANGVIKVVVPVATLGSSVTTAKTGTLGMPANPVIAQANVAYPTTVASSTATTWSYVAGSPSYDPSVTRGTSPEIRLNRPATAAGTAMVNTLAVLVDVQPAIYGIGVGSLGNRSLGVPRGTSTTAQSISTSSTGTASFLRQIGKIASLTSTASVLVPRLTGFTRNLTSTATSTLFKLLPRSYSTSSANSTTRALQVGKNATATNGSSSLISRAISKTTSLAATNTPTIIRSVSRSFSTSSTGAASLVALRRLVRTLNLSASGSATATRQTNKSATTTTSGTATLIRLTAKALTATATGTPTRVRAVLRTMSVAATGTSSIIRLVSKTLAATATGSSTLTTIRLYARALSTTATGGATISRAVARTMSASVSSVRTIIRQIQTARSISASGTASITRLISQTQTLSASVVATSIRQAIKSASTSSAVSTSLIKQGIRTLASSTSNLPSMTRRALLNRSISVAGTVSRIVFVSKSFNVSSPVSAFVYKTQYLVLSVAKAVVATLSAAPTFGATLYMQTISATISVVSTASRAVSITKTATETALSSATKLVSNSRTAIAVSVTSAFKQASKSLLASATTNATYRTLTTHALAALNTASASISKLVALTRSATVTEIVSLATQSITLVFRTLTATATTSVSVTRSTLKIIMATPTIVSSFNRYVTKTITRSVTALASLAITRFIMLAAFASSVARMTKVAGKAVSVLQSASIQTNRSIYKTLSITSHITALMERLGHLVSVAVTLAVKLIGGLRNSRVKLSDQSSQVHGSQALRRIRGGLRGSRASGNIED